MQMKGTLKNYKEGLKTFTSTYLEVLSKKPGGRWPMPYINSVESTTIIDPHLFKDIRKIMRIIKEKNISFKEISKEAKYPSSLSRFFHITRPLKFKKKNMQEVKKFLIYNANAMNHLYLEDSFCKNGTNILYEKEKVLKLFKKYKKMDNKLVKIANFLLFQYTEFVYMYFHNFGHETHGPYQFEDYQIIIREYHNLNPYFVKTNMPDTITIIEKHKKDNKITIDISNRLSSENPFNESLIEATFNISAKRNELDSDKKLVDFLKKEVLACIKTYKKTNKIELTKHLAHIHYHQLRPYSKVTSYPLNLPKKLFDDIENQDEVLKPLSKYLDNIFSKKIDLELANAFNDPDGPDVFSTLDKK